MKKIKKGIVAALSLAALSAFSVGATLATSADAVIDESKFVMAKQISVRTENFKNAQGLEVENSKGLRFKTVAKEFKEDLNAAYPTGEYTYNWYTELRFKKFEGNYSTDAKGNEYHLATTYELVVPVAAWNDEGGWNTVLLGIPMSDGPSGEEDYTYVKDDKGIYAKDVNGNYFKYQTEAGRFSLVDGTYVAATNGDYVKDESGNYVNVVAGRFRLNTDAFGHIFYKPYVESNVALDITAQSFVEITSKATGEMVYEAESDTLTYSAAKAASLALAYHKYENTTQKDFLLTYVDNAIDCGDIKEINLPRTTFGVQVGTSDWLEASSYPAGYGVTYTSADPSIAKVDYDGRVTGIEEGTTEITVSIGSTLSKVCTVTVRANGDLPETITSFTSSSNPLNAYSKATVSIASEQVQITPGGKQPALYLTQEYLDHTFGISSVKAIRLKLTGLSNYTIRQFIMNYTTKHTVKDENGNIVYEDDGVTPQKGSTLTGTFSSAADKYTNYEKDGDVIWLQINRGAYEQWYDQRKDENEPFSFRMEFIDLTATENTHSAVKVSTFKIESIEPIYDDLTLDFEDRAYNDSYVYTSQYVIPSAETVKIAKVTDRTMGRGDYSLAATTSDTSMSVSIASAYATKVFASANALQFRVYTAKNFEGVTVNGSSTNVQYVYNADGEYYTIRIAKAVGSASDLTVVLNSGAVLETVYFDAFTGTDKALGLNVSKTDAYATDNGGETTFNSQETFNFYAYSSVSDGRVSVNGIPLDLDFDYEESTYSYEEGTYSTLKRPTLESFQELKDAGFNVVMPQSVAVVGKGTLDANGNLNTQGGGGGFYDYRDVLEVAEQVGLKVILTDNQFWFASNGETAMSTAMYTSELDENGAGVPGSALYNFVKAQLLSYGNYPAFYGVLLRDEARAWAFDKNLTPNSTYKAGSYALIYRTIRAVSDDLYAVWNAAEDKEALVASGAAYLNKEVYIHANLIGATSYSAYNKHTSSSAVCNYPELTVKRYLEITGMPVSTSYANANGSYDYIAAAGSQFYIDLDKYVITTYANRNDVERRTELQFAIMRERFGAYCQLFIDATGADYIAPDFYPLYATGPMDVYLMALQTAAEVARANDVDLYVVTQTQGYDTGSGTPRIMTDEDVRWLNNTLLSFGVKNIIYFTYHHHGDDGSGAFYDGSSFMYTTGEKSSVWYSMQKLMAENQAFASTYQSFELNATKSYYSEVDFYDSEHAGYVKDVVYDETVYDNGALFANGDCHGGVNNAVEVNFAKATVDTDADAAIVSEFIDDKGNYMYSVMNVIDAQYNDVDSYESVTLTFDAAYTHVILWRNGVKKLVALDENNSITIENGAGEAVFMIPYKYEERPGYFWDSTQEDNGVWFPSEDTQEGIWS